MSKRSIKEWNNKFICVQSLMNTMDYIWETYKDESMIESFATMLRNPIIFDNNIKEVKNILPYHVEGMEIGTQDHLIGMSNIVLYIFKKQLHKKWKTLDDFKNTLKSLNVLLPISKSLNNAGQYKNGWSFKIDSIEESLNWDKKLISVGITHLIHNETKERVEVQKIKDGWIKETSKYIL